MPPARPPTALSPEARAHVQPLLETAIRTVGGDGGCVYALEPDAGVLRQVVTIDIPPELSRVPVPVGHGVAGTAVARRETQRIEHYPGHPLAREPFLSDGLQTVMATPLLVGSRAWGAVSVISHRPGHRFGEADARALEAVAARIAAAIAGGTPA